MLLDGEDSVRSAWIIEAPISKGSRTSGAGTRSTLSITGHLLAAHACYRLSYMAIPHTEVRRLRLRLERAVAAQAHLKTLSIAAQKTVAGHRRALRIAIARLKRPRRADRGHIGDTTTLVRSRVEPSSK